LILTVATPAMIDHFLDQFTTWLGLFRF